MKKTVRILRFILIALCLIWPAIYLITEYAFDFEAVAAYPLIPCGALCLIFIIETMLAFIALKRDGEDYKTGDSIVSAVLLFVSIFYGIMCRSKIGIILAAVDILLAFVMFFITTKSKLAKGIVIVLTAVFALGFIWASLAHSDAFDDETVKTLVSPDGSKTAYLIDRHGEFLGADVEVLVYGKDDVKDCILVRFIRYGCRVWDENRMTLTENGAVDYPTIEWQDDSTLIVNGVQYPIN